MLIENIRIERKKAVLLTVDFSGRIDEYALAWLKLTNNAREYPKMIWHISNDRDNNVYIYCNPKSAENIKEFVTGIVGCYREDEDKVHYVGKVLNEEKIEVGFPVYKYESSYSMHDPRWEEDMDSAVLNWMPMIED